MRYDVRILVESVVDGFRPQVQAVRSAAGTPVGPAARRPVRHCVGGTRSSGSDAVTVDGGFRLVVGLFLAAAAATAAVPSVPLHRQSHADDARDRSYGRDAPDGYHGHHGRNAEPLGRYGRWISKRKKKKNRQINTRCWIIVDRYFRGRYL